MTFEKTYVPSPFLSCAQANIGSIVNLQVEYFIQASGGSIVTTLGEIGTALAAAFHTV